MSYKQITTTGQFRRELMNLVDDIRSGVLPIDKANSIHRIVSQVNENIGVEVRMMKATAALGKEVSEIGAMVIANKIETID